MILVVLVINLVENTKITNIITLILVQHLLILVKQHLHTPLSHQNSSQHHHKYVAVSDFSPLKLVGRVIFILNLCHLGFNRTNCHL